MSLSPQELEVIELLELLHPSEPGVGHLLQNLNLLPQ